MIRMTLESIREVVDLKVLPLTALEKNGEGCAVLKVKKFNGKELDWSVLTQEILDKVSSPEGMTLFSEGTGFREYHMEWTYTKTSKSKLDKLVVTKQRSGILYIERRQDEMKLYLIHRREYDYVINKENKTTYLQGLWLGHFTSGFKELKGFNHSENSGERKKFLGENQLEMIQEVLDNLDNVRSKKRKSVASVLVVLSLLGLVAFVAGRRFLRRRVAQT